MANVSFTQTQTFIYILIYIHTVHIFRKYFLVYGLYCFNRLAFLGFQLIFALFLLENFIDIPPFTSTPMFVIVSRLDDKCPQHYVLSDEVNSDIKYDRLEWMYPYIDEQSGVGFNPSDVESIPFK